MSNWLSVKAEEEPSFGGSSVYFRFFHLPFLPSVPLRAEPATPETPAGLLRFRSRQGCQGECTGQCARFRAAEYRNCWWASFCGPSWLFPPVRYEIFKVQLWTGGRSVADGMAPFLKNWKCRRLSSNGLDGRLHFAYLYYITLGVGVNKFEKGVRCRIIAVKKCLCRNRFPLLFSYCKGIV